jgi:hypothetical protein
MTSNLYSCWLASVIALATQVAVAEPAKLVRTQPLLKTIRSVGPKGVGHKEAADAWRQLSNTPASQLPDVLAGMDGADLLVSNWIRSAVEAIADRELKAGGTLPLKALEEFLHDTNHSPHARRVAFELIVRVDPDAKTRLIPGFINDPSLELRREAVAALLAKAADLAGPAKSERSAVPVLHTALTAARDADQINQASEQLKKLGQKVDLPSHFGFVLRWHLIGPFDNADKSGFDVAYAPEKGVDLSATSAGKEGEVKWIEHTTGDEYGLVDLNKALGKHMGVIGYAYAEFMSPQERDVELRLGCINGNKIWLNGQLLTANHIYHAGTQIDQYVGKGRLRKGRNEILLKIAQNDWAQNWQFQLRVCDQYGTAILPQE